MRKLQTSSFDTFCLCPVKEDRQQQKEEAEKRTDKKEATKFDQRNIKN